MTNKTIVAETLIDEVRSTLEKAFHGKNNTPAFLSTFQILNRITSRDELITQEGGAGGKGFGDKGGGAATVVKNTLRMLRTTGEVTTFYMDGNDEVQFLVAGKTITPGNQTFALHRFTGRTAEEDIE